MVFIGSFSSVVYYIQKEPSTASAAPGNPAPFLNPGHAATLIVTPLPSPLPTVETSPEAGWSLVQPGLERRAFEVYNGQHQLVESLYVWRLDQRYFRLDVAYEERPKTLQAWQAQTNAAIVLNGGYYSIDNERYFPDGLTVVKGQASGRSFNRGGMLAIQPSGAELRWLEERRYDPNERLQAALQSFPILVRPGGQLGYGPEKETHASARRTVIGQDKNGRILLMVAPQGYFTLHQLSRYLTESDLNLDIAVNLDGGGSTGIMVANPEELISPTRPIPFVILVYPR
jgi:uncharacterized protein YigE (DUF2233 family)